MTRDEFEFEMEYAALTDDRDRAVIATMNYARLFRPLEMARIGGWQAESEMLRAAYGTSRADHNRKPLV